MDKNDFQIDGKKFREAMSNLSAAVNIVTTNGPLGIAGFTASAICSVSDSPPTLLVCLNRSSSFYNIFKENGVLCINTLAANQENLSIVFGGKTPMSQRFSYAHWEELITTAPILKNALVSFDCKIDSFLSVGSHDVIFCKVLAIKSNAAERDALIYFKRKYCKVETFITKIA
ncbi:flavin reductase [Acinetobacter gerneri]|uniref:flavin reductase n=1 Tax=Acinetobacter gerneri TaxID=202952 RepID=UPI0029368FA8|nr:flavin reductase [Acinetobacter gerneri]MDV2438957.1 flavin reductase [Acinetobacter gerneri]